MFGFSWLDAVLLVWLIWQLIYGIRAGLLVSFGGLLGFVVGAVAAFFAVPLVNQYAPSPGWRTALVIAVTIIFIAAGHFAGISLGRAIGRRMKSGPIKSINRILGGALNVVVAALVISLLAFGVGNLGIPVVSAQLSQSTLLANIDSWTPKPVKSAVAQLRSLVIEEGIPKLLYPGNGNVDVASPTSSTDTPALKAASKSVFKITGTAFQCGQNQTGTGFVVAKDRVLTNAHVVAGVSLPVVQTQDQGVLSASVIYFDPAKDLALLAVNGLDAQPLASGENLPANSSAAFAGYPLGGPLQVRPAKVLGSSSIMVPSFQDNGQTLANIYQLAGNIQSGNSGGPLLNQQGQVVGVIFAKTTTSKPLGFAFTMNEVSPVIAAAPTLSRTVPTGSCSAK